MTQAHTAKPASTATTTPATSSSSLGAAAAAAATGTAADATKTGTATADKPADKPDDKAAGATTGAGAEPAASKGPGSKIYVSTGPVLEFDTVAKAEKYLNGPDAPSDYAVLRGKRIGTSKKVSLR